jgi:hypothetical protein
MSIRHHRPHPRSRRPLADRRCVDRLMGREKNNKKLNSLLSPRHALAAVLDKTNYRQSVCLGGPLRGNHPTTAGSGAAFFGFGRGHQMNRPVSRPTSEWFHARTEPASAGVIVPLRLANRALRSGGSQQNKLPSCVGIGHGPLRRRKRRGTVVVSRVYTAWGPMWLHIGP